MKLDLEAKNNKMCLFGFFEFLAVGRGGARFGTSRSTDASLKSVSIQIQMVFSAITSSVACSKSGFVARRLKKPRSW